MKSRIKSGSEQVLDSPFSTQRDLSLSKYLFHKRTEFNLRANEKTTRFGCLRPRLFLKKMVNELVGWNNYIIINLRNTRDLNEVGPVEICITMIIHRAEICNRNMHAERRMPKWEIWF